MQHGPGKSAETSGSLQQSVLRPEQEGVPPRVSIACTVLTSNASKQFASYRPPGPDVAISLGTYVLTLLMTPPLSRPPQVWRAFSRAWGQPRGQTLQVRLPLLMSIATVSLQDSGSRLHDT